jgi:hypothetical protein
MTASPDNIHSITEASKQTTTKEKRKYTKSDSLGAYNVFGASNGGLNSATNRNSLSTDRKEELSETQQNYSYIFCTSGLNHYASPL